MFDIVIANGIIISGHDRYRPLIGSIGIKDGRIEYVGTQRLAKTDGRSYICLLYTSDAADE